MQLAPYPFSYTHLVKATKLSYKPRMWTLVTCTSSRKHIVCNNAFWQSLRVVALNIITRTNFVDRMGIVECRWLKGKSWKHTLVHSTVVPHLPFSCQVLLPFPLYGLQSRVFSLFSSFHAVCLLSRNLENGRRCSEVSEKYFDGSTAVQMYNFYLHPLHFPLNCIINDCMHAAMFLRIPSSSSIENGKTIIDC